MSRPIIRFGSAKRDVNDEIAFHLEMREREFIAQGMTPEEARRAAAAAFGDVSAIRSALRVEREALGRARARRDWSRGLVLDATFALRTLRKHWGFALAAALTLALGIGGTASIFTIVNGVLLRPLPYADPSRLVMLWTAGEGMREITDVWPLSSGLYDELRREARSFESTAAFRSWGHTLGDAEEPEPVASARVTPTLFGVLGVRPLLGRTFTEVESRPGGPNVVVIGHDLWRRRFGGASDVLGRTIALSGQRFTIIGVMPPGFTFPRGAELPAPLGFRPRTDLWTPLVLTEADLRDYGTQNLSGIGRLRRDVSLPRAQQELDALMRRTLERAGLTKLRLSYKAVGLGDQAAAPVRRGLLILLGAVAFVLLIACANVANLLIARTATRQKELAVRTALGAGRARIARQLVTENVLLALGGGALGMLLAVWGTRIMLALVPGSLPRADDIVVDARVVLSALLIAAVAGTLFGLVTAWHASRWDVGAVLQGSSGRTTSGAAQRAGRRILVALEVGLSLVLLIGAGLLIGSFARLQRIDPGFATDHVLTAGLTLPIPGRFDPTVDGPRWSALFEQLTSRLGALPGVRAAGAVSSLPLTGLVESGGFRIEGRPRPEPGRAPSAQYQVVSGDYFRVIGMPLVQGRAFDSRDRADGVPVVIVNRAFVREHFPGEPVLGRRIVPGFDFTGAPRTIVGVVADARQTSLEAAPLPVAFVPETQMPYPFLSLVVRTSGDPLAALPAVRRELRALDPTLALSDVRTMANVFQDSLARQRFSMTMLGVFAGAALVLALVGLYGVIALSVGQRTREIGVRMALGARRRDVLRMVLTEGASVTAAGVALGLIGAVALTRLLRALLYDISTTDPATFGASAALVIAVALMATLIPARRATRVDPVSAMRVD